MPELGRPAIIAIGFAVVALVTSGIAVIVVARRDAPVVKESAGTPERSVDADEVMKLKRDVLGKTDAGVVVADAELRKALGLEENDVLTAINGRAIKREFDVYDAVLGMSQMNASIVYVELSRGGKPMLVRWKLVGDLTPARRDSNPDFGGNPFTAPRDPLVDSIRRVDPLRFEVPRTTIDRLLANRDFYARQARIIPVVVSGQPKGYKLFAIRTGSAWAAIGLFNGDIIKTVNGEDPANPDEYNDASELKILVERRGGTEETIVIAIQ